MRQKSPTVNRFAEAPKPTNEITLLTNTACKYSDNLHDHIVCWHIQPHRTEPESTGISSSSSDSGGSSSSCVMVVLDDTWKPGRKAIFRWRVVPCYEQFHTSMVICDIQTKVTRSVKTQHVIFYIDALQLLRPVLAISCSKQHLITIKSGRVSGRYLNAEAGYFLDRVLISLNLYSKDKMACFDKFEKTRHKKHVNSFDVKFKLGKLSLNDEHCSNGAINIADRCLKATKQYIHTPGNTDLSENNNPIMSHLLSLFTQHRICTVQIEDDHHNRKLVRETKDHPWCTKDSGLLVKYANITELSESQCERDQFELYNEECISVWATGEKIITTLNKKPFLSNFVNLYPSMESHKVSRYFLCESSVIPFYRVCDGHSDCPNSTDETYCLSEHLTKPLPKILKGSSRKPTMLGDINRYKDGCPGQFACNGSHICIPLELVNDLFPDCPISSTMATSADETLLASIDSGEDKCSNSALPCLPGHPKCFSISSLCHYDLDSYGHLKYCRNGAHLAACGRHQCSGMYKCPISYCIPVVRVCDQINDCPYGEDEVDCPAKGVTCPGMLRCQAGGCVHPQGLGDGKDDCPLYGDDEMFCDMGLCPRGCTCMWYTVVCRSSTVTRVQVRNMKLLDISGSRPTGYFPRIIGGSMLLIFKFAENSLTVVKPEMFSQTVNVAEIDLKNNAITVIKPLSFSNLTNLRKLDFHGNYLAVIEVDSFTNLPLLRTLNFTNSSLQMIRHTSIVNTGVTVIDVSNTPLTLLDVSLLDCDTSACHVYVSQTMIDTIDVKVYTTEGLHIHTDVPYHCCIFPECIGPKPLPHLCFNTFPKATDNGTWVLPLLTTITNLVILVLRVMDKKPLVQSAHVGVNFNGCCIGLCVLLVYGHSTYFSASDVQHEGGARHKLCLAISGVQYTAILLMLPLQVLYLYSVYIIFKNNMNNLRHQAKYATAQVLTLIIVSFILVGVSYIISLAMYGDYPALTELCSLHLAPIGNVLNSVCRGFHSMAWFVAAIIIGNLYIGLWRSLQVSQSQFATGDSVKVTSLNVFTKARNTFILYGLVPIVFWGVPELIYELCAYTGVRPTEESGMVIITSILPLWTLLNPAEFIIRYKFEDKSH